jgi:hypothetical protein
LAYFAELDLAHSSSKDTKLSNNEKSQEFAGKTSEQTHAYLRSVVASTVFQRRNPLILSELWMSRVPNRFAAVFELLTYRACHDSRTLESLGLSIVHFAHTHTSQDPPQCLRKAHAVSPIRRHHVPYKRINMHAEARGIPSQTQASKA